MLALLKQPRLLNVVNYKLTKHLSLAHRFDGQIGVWCKHYKLKNIPPLTGIILRGSRFDEWSKFESGTDLLSLGSGGWVEVKFIDS